MSYIKNTWVNDETELSAQNFNYIENGIYENQNIEIIAISEDEPSTFNNGDKYYNITDNKIYTANDGEWDDGETPIRGALYILIDDQVTYYYDGKTLVSVGGGTEDILIQEEEPEEGKIWIDTAEVFNAGSLALEMYPIGSMYLTTLKEFNPNSAWGGTWEQLDSDAYFKIVTGENGGKLGGTNSQHKIPLESMPSHNHAIKWGNYTPSVNQDGSNLRIPWTDFKGNNEIITAENAGGSQPYYPYYYGVYAWHRTA